MTNVMIHKGYSATVEFDNEDGIFFGKVAGIRDGIGFHGESVGELRAAFREAVDDYLVSCAALGRAPQKPYSGKLMLRVDPMVHANAAVAAQLAGMSLNQWGEKAIREAVDRTAEHSAA